MCDPLSVPALAAAYQTATRCPVASLSLQLKLHECASGFVIGRSEAKKVPSLARRRAAHPPVVGVDDQLFLQFTSTNSSLFDMNCICDGVSVALCHRCISTI